MDRACKNRRSKWLIYLLLDFSTPLIFIPVKATCNVANAQAELGMAQINHSRLLSRSSQNPQFRLAFLSAETYHEAVIVTIIASH